EEKCELVDRAPRRAERALANRRRDFWRLYAPVDESGEKADCGIDEEHRLQRLPRRPAEGELQPLGRHREQRAQRAEQRADEAVAREQRRALGGRDGLRENGLLERKEDA